MKTPQLSRPSRWLLLYLAEIHPDGVSSVVPLPCSDYRDQPKMAQVNGLVRRGWAIEKFPGNFFITSQGLEAAKQYT